MTRAARKRSARRTGYVLLVTLALLMLSTTLLVAVGRGATRHAMEARLEQARLQQKWGVESCRSSVLAHAEQILVSTEAARGTAVGEVRAQFKLGEATYTLIVADEQAKANVNAIIEQAGPEIAADRIRQNLIGSGLINKVILRPALLSSEPVVPTTRPTPLIFGPGQIFDALPPKQLIGARFGGQPALGSITCWGDGTLNVMRANRMSMQLLCTPSLFQVEIFRLLDARDQVMRAKVTQHASGGVQGVSSDAISGLLSRAQISPAKRNQLPLTAHSSCHSLWIIAADSGRETYNLFVSDESDSRRPTIHRFAY